MPSKGGLQFSKEDLMGYISRLQAINEMLLTAGEDVVSDLDNNSGIDTGIAEFILDRASEEFQYKGIAGNTYVKKCKPDSNNKIMLPSDTLGVRLLSHHVSDKEGYKNFIIEATVRGEPNGYLFNVTEQSDTWDDEEYTIEFIQFMRWEDMDTSIQKSIIISAARHYQIITMGDGDIDRYLASKEGISLGKAKATDVLDKNRSIFTGDLARRAFMNRGHTANDPSRVRYWRHR